MRIISDFRDYYDSVQAYGQDQSVIYKRVSNSNQKNFLKPKYYTKLCIIETGITIGFCGKFYQCVIAQELNDVGKVIKKFYAYSREELDNWVKKSVSKKARKHYFNEDTPKWLTRMYKSKEWFDQTSSPSNGPFITLKSPIIIGETVNPCLKDYQFYKVVDTYTAYQEIQMFLSNVLCVTDGHKTKYAGKPMSDEISDKDMVTAKGFNKWSFRKEPRK